MKTLPIVVCALGLLAAPVSVAAAATEQAEQVDPGHPTEIVRRTTDEMLGRLNRERAHLTAHPEELETLIREVLYPHMAHRYTARLILGRHGRGVSDAKVDEFGEALGDLLIRRYADGLLKIRPDTKIRVLPLRGELKPRLTMVKTRVRLDNGQYAPIDYAFRETEDGWKVFDVRVEGVSYVQTFRNQIGLQIRDKGLDRVIADLKADRVRLDVDGDDAADA